MGPLLPRPCTPIRGVSFPQGTGSAPAFSAGGEHKSVPYEVEPARKALISPSFKSFAPEGLRA